MGRCRTENKKREGEKKTILRECVQVCARAFFFFVRAPLTFICAVYPKAICPAVAEFRQIGAAV